MYDRDRLKMKEYIGNLLTQIDRKLELRLLFLIKEIHPKRKLSSTY